MRNSYKVLAAFLLVAVCASAALAATPSPNGALIKLKIWNDSPLSTASSINSYPSMIVISDEGLSGCGFANLHNWSFSEDGGATWAAFDNNSQFRFAADVVCEGTGDGEAYMRISPWWSKDGDGEFMLNTRTGEIAIFGGRLPFWSFTIPAHGGLTYAKGQMVRMEMIYLPHSLTAGDPATVEYVIWVAGVRHSSGPLAFDMANPAEDPPYGLWGMLNDGRVGGAVKAYADCGNTDARFRVTWSRIEFYGAGTTPVSSKTWGNLKRQYK
ncbi:MAG: hypothetical protein HZB25_11565 [Candidatus Eisenbacteria bacterium]|nr:hypothetical protein [Candidatus Eisenbacteria bacterium]